MYSYKMVGNIVGASGVRFGPGSKTKIIAAGSIHTYNAGGSNDDEFTSAKRETKAAHKLAKEAKKTAKSAQPIDTIDLCRLAIDGKYQKGSEDGQVWQATLVPGDLYTASHYFCEWWGVTDPITGKFPYETLKLYRPDTGTLGGLSFKYQITAPSIWPYGK